MKQALQTIICIAGMLGGTAHAVHSQTEETMNHIAPSAAYADTPLQRGIYLKTNAVAWSFAVANAEVEMDVARHWSVDLPIQYSGWNYFQSRRKYRTLSFYPGARYWTNPTNNGFFAGAHLGLAYYNVAFEGRYRTQDRGGHHPAFGGGLSVGYRLPLRRNSCWSIEANVGAGVYALCHDKFANDHNGQWIATERKTYFGLDQLALSVCYRFPLRTSGTPTATQP